ncbi:MAG: hypothetical protein WDW38_009462 [Sanguina aurantia]
MSINEADVARAEEDEMLILRARANQLAASPGVQRLLANPQLLMQMAESDPELLKVLQSNPAVQALLAQNRQQQPALLLSPAPVSQETTPPTQTNTQNSTESLSVPQGHQSQQSRLHQHDPARQSRPSDSSHAPMPANFPGFQIPSSAVAEPHQDSTRTLGEGYSFVHQEVDVEVNLDDLAPEVAAQYGYFVPHKAAPPPGSSPAPHNCNHEHPPHHQHTTPWQEAHAQSHNHQHPHQHPHHPNQFPHHHQQNQPQHHHHQQQQQQPYGFPHGSYSSHQLPTLSDPRTDLQPPSFSRPAVQLQQPGWDHHHQQQQHQKQQPGWDQQRQQQQQQWRDPNTTSQALQQGSFTFPPLHPHQALHASQPHAHSHSQQQQQQQQLYHGPAPGQLPGTSCYQSTPTLPSMVQGDGGQQLHSALPVQPSWLRWCSRKFCSEGDAIFVPIWMTLAVYLSSQEQLPFLLLLALLAGTFLAGFHAFAAMMFAVPLKHVLRSRFLFSFIVSIEVLYPLAYLRCMLPSWSQANAPVGLLLSAALTAMPILHYLCVTSDPGFVPRTADVPAGSESPRLPLLLSAPTPPAHGLGPDGCWTCHSARPLRSKHCSACGRCVGRFDHHCPAIANCVGQGNQRAFLLYLTAILMAQILYLCASFSFLWQAYSGNPFHRVQTMDVPNQGQDTDVQMVLEGATLSTAGIQQAWAVLAWAVHHHRGLVLLVMLQLPLIPGAFFMLMRGAFLAAANLTANEWINRQRYYHLLHATAPTPDTLSATHPGDGSSTDGGSKTGSDSSGRHTSAARYCNRFDQGPLRNLFQFWFVDPKTDWGALFESGDRQMAELQRPYLSVFSLGRAIRWLDLRFPSQPKRSTRQNVRTANDGGHQQQKYPSPLHHPTQQGGMLQGYSTGGAVHGQQQFHQYGTQQ